MFYHNHAEDYIQQQNSSFNSESIDISINFIKELLVFLGKYPEFAEKRSHMDMLLYCYDFYINSDPLYSDLPLQKKLEHAGEVAKNLLRTIIEG